MFQTVLVVDYFPAGGVTFLFRQESNQRSRLRGGAEVVPFRLGRFLSPSAPVQNRPPLSTPPGTLRVVATAW